MVIPAACWLALSTASAAPSWEANAGAAAAVDVWDGQAYAHGAVDARLGLQSGRSWVSYGAALIGWAGASWLDAHQLDLGISSGPLGVRMGAQGSAALGYGQLRAEALWTAGGGRRGLQLGLGPTVWLGDLVALGGGGTALVWQRLGPRWRVSLVAQGAAYAREGPPGLVGAAATARGSLAPPLELRLRTRAWGAWQRSAEGRTDPRGATRVGLPLPGSHGVSLSGRLLRHLGPVLALGADLQAELGGGSSSYSRWYAGGRVQARLGSRAEAPPPAAEQAHFVVHAPEAEEVELLASFLDWQPRSLVRQADGSWALRLTLPPGEHEYVYRVDGELVTPPEASVRRSDGFGGENGVIIIR